MSTSLPLLEVRQLVKAFPPARGGASRASTLAVDNVSLTVEPGDVLGIVGASGSGKSTLARILTRLITPTSGTVLLRGVDIHALDDDAVRAQVRPAIRMIFQDPDAALNPAYTIGDGLRRALRLGGRTPAERIDEVMYALLGEVGLVRSYADKYPDELSGGEKRRLGICRVLASNPAVVVADEPLSGLDVVLQERVLALLLKEQEQRRFALLLVSHDLDRVHQACSRVVVMFSGRIVESAPVTHGEMAPSARYRHPYAIMLAEAKDAFDRGLRLPVHGEGEAEGSSLSATPVESDGAQAMEREQHGCAFRRYCARYRALVAPARCASEVPELQKLTEGWRVACHFATEA